MGMSRVFWDTNLFIYLFERHPVFSPGVKALLAKMSARGDQLFTSALSVGEITAKPLELGDLARSIRYEKAMQEAAIVLIFDLPAAREFAKIRAQRMPGIRPPDALQLACASSAGIDLFLTNDSRLHGMKVDGIHFITSVERAPI
jgi:predicted nucleic acid-binding protein